jgi:RNA polymerase sigma-70 factor (ECF subfamily)
MESDARQKRKERRLVKGLRRRDPRAFEGLYEEYGNTVVGYLVNTLRDRPTAEDVSQQVFFELWRRAEEYDPERASLFTWVMTIARSRAIDHLRRRIPEPVDPADMRDLADAESTPAESLDAVVERWHVAQLLRRLPDEQLSLMRMRFYEGLSQSEIAERTGTPLGTIKWRMSDALKRLRELIDEEGAEGMAR